MNNNHTDDPTSQIKLFKPVNSSNNRPPIAISYRPKANDYLPVVVASIRRYLGDWPIALLCEEQHLPPAHWLEQNQVHAITDWSHSARANKVLRLWEHQTVFSHYFDQWIWWHDDMVLLRSVEDPTVTFARPLIARRQRRRPNKELGNWHCWLWDTLMFFRCQNIYAPNPVLHVPRLIRRDALADIPEHWNRSRLLFEPTYLLWHWHRTATEPVLARDERQAIFKGDIPSLNRLEQETEALILTFGKKIDHETSRQTFGEHYPVNFSPLAPGHSGHLTASKNGVRFICNNATLGSGSINLKNQREKMNLTPILHFRPSERTVC